MQPGSLSEEELFAALLTDEKLRPAATILRAESQQRRQRVRRSLRKGVHAAGIGLRAAPIGLQQVLPTGGCAGAPAPAAAAAVQ